MASQLQKAIPNMTVDSVMSTVPFENIGQELKSTNKVLDDRSAEAENFKNEVNKLKKRLNEMEATAEANR